LKHKILGTNTDFFLDYKFSKIQNHFGQSCLDVGTGTGRFAQYLINQGKEVTAIDVVNKVESDIAFHLFNGYEIPLASQSVDTTLVFFVLHHTDYQEQLLKECKRVSRKTIIIGEDVIENKFDRIMGRIHLGTSPWSTSETGFRTDSEWKTLFYELELKLIDTVIIPRNIYPIYPVTRRIYVLQSK